MKKIFTTVLLIITFSAGYLSAQFQVSNSAYVLPKGVTQIGINPFTMIYNGDNEENNKYYATNFVAGMGMGHDFDVQLKMGLFQHTFGNPTEKADMEYYLGIDFEKRLLNTGHASRSGFEISVTGGVHSWGEHVGFDGTVNFAYRTEKKAFIYTGFDLDANLEEEIIYENEAETEASTEANKVIVMYYWIPVGFEMFASKNISVSLEVDVPLQAKQHFVVGAGISIYINQKTRKVY